MFFLMQEAKNLGIIKSHLIEEDPEASWQSRTKLALIVFDKIPFLQPPLQCT